MMNSQKETSEANLTDPGPMETLETINVEKDNEKDPPVQDPAPMEIQKVWPPRRKLLWRHQKAETKKVPLSRTQLQWR